VVRSPEVAADDALGPREPSLSRVILYRVILYRVILYRVSDKRVIQLAANPNERHASALEELGGPVACVQLHDGIQLCCNRGGLVFGLALARRALALSLAEPSRFEVRLRFENSELALGPKEWPANGDFVLARVGVGGELVDLTEDDIRLWMFWLGSTTSCITDGRRGFAGDRGVVRTAAATTAPG
jgi:hypothetical protein